MALFLVLLANVGLVHSASQAVTGPSANSLPKVLSMLENMKAKGEKDMHDEEIEFTKFSTNCKEDSKNLKAHIAKQGDEIELANGQIGVKTNKVTKLTKEITKLATKVETDTSDLQAAQQKRQTGHKAYLAESQDYSESVTAIGNALVVLQRQNYDREEMGNVGASLLQLSGRRSLPVDAQSALASFLDTNGKDSEEAPPEANAYEFQSEGIMSMLKGLEDKFKEKLNDCQKREMNAQNAFEMVVKDLRDSVAIAKANKAEKVQMKEQKVEEIASLTAMVTSTTATKEEDEKNLEDLGVECREKEASYIQKRQLRRDEIAAISQAIEILSGSAVTAGTETLSLAQKTGRALVQVREASRMHSRSVRDRQRVRDYLSNAGERLHSGAISLLAQKLQADPFADVKSLIDDLISKLRSEAMKDAEKSGFCETEMGLSKITREDLTQRIDTKTSELEEKRGEILRLAQEIAELTKSVGDLQDSMTKATNLRHEEQAMNKVKIADAAAAQKAVEAATLLLKEYYEKAATGATLEGTQLRSKYPKMGTPEWEVLGVDANPPIIPEMKPRQTFGKVYTGQQDMAGGVVALLEVIQSDFATVVTSTTQAEYDATEEYKSFIKDGNQNVAVKESTIQTRESERVQAEGTEVSLTAELKTLQKEMAAAQNYWENLEPQCVDQGTTFEERQKQIKQEISSLKEALEILNNANTF